MRMPACASYSEPRAVSKRRRQLPAAVPKASAVLRPTELSARRTCDAEISIFALYRCHQRTCERYDGECLFENFGAKWRVHAKTGAGCVTTSSHDSRKLEGCWRATCATRQAHATQRNDVQPCRRGCRRRSCGRCCRCGCCRPPLPPQWPPRLLPAADCYGCESNSVVRGCTQRWTAALRQKIELS